MIDRILDDARKEVLCCVDANFNSISQALRQQVDRNQNQILTNSIKRIVEILGDESLDDKEKVTRISDELLIR